jgi:hypothetical protein
MALDQMQRRSESIVTMLSSFEDKEDPDFRKAKKGFEVLVKVARTEDADELCTSWSHMNQKAKKNAFEEAK